MPSYSIPIRADLEPRLRLAYALDDGTDDDVRLALDEYPDACTYLHLNNALARFFLSPPDERGVAEGFIATVLQRGGRDTYGYLQGSPEWADLVARIADAHGIVLGQPGALSAPCLRSSSQSGV